MELQKASAQTDTGLATTTAFSNELAPTAAAAEKQYEIQSAIVLANRFPRSEDAAFQKLMRSCGRSSFAEDAEYSFPRGGATVSGPSVNLAREAARVWGNIRHGLTILSDQGDDRVIQAWAWDLETNIKVVAEDSFKKLIFRKGYNGAEGKWIQPDERDLRELTNRRGAIIVRNCILQILPKDLIEDALGACKQTLQTRAAQDPDGERKKVLMAFSGINVTAEMLEAYLKHPISQCSPVQIAELRTIYKSINDGNSTWPDYVKPTPADIKTQTESNVESLKSKLKKDSKEPESKATPMSAEEADAYSAKQEKSDDE